MQANNPMLIVGNSKKLLTTPQKLNSSTAGRRTRLQQANSSLQLASYGTVVKKRCCKVNNGNSGLKTYHLQGKTQHQVQRRNERERRRVQAVNKGYEDLAQRLADWEELKNKKLTKAQTLKAAIMYIEHMEELLGNSTTNVNFTKMNFNHIDFSSSASSSSIFDDIHGDENEMNEDEEEEEAENENQEENFEKNLKIHQPKLKLQNKNYQFFNKTTTTKLGNSEEKILNNNFQQQQQFLNQQQQQQYYSNTNYISQQQQQFLMQNHYY